MDFDTFKEKAEKIVDYMPEEYRDASVSIRKTWKVNCVKTALSVFPSESSKAAATIYVEDLYRHYQECQDTDLVFSRAAERLVEGIKHMPENVPPVDYSKLRENVIMVLVNSAENEDMLQYVPSKPFHDLSIVFRWVMSQDDESIGSVLVTNRLAEAAEISTEDLFLCAVKNTKRLFPVKVCTMIQNMIEKIQSEKLEQLEGVLPCSDKEQLWVISNEFGINGAVSVFYEECLYSLAERVGTDLYVIPSSVHEMLAVSVDMCTSQELSELILNVNQSHVLPEERLSNNFYYYDKDLHTLTLLTDSKKRLG